MQRYTSLLWWTELRAVATFLASTILVLVLFFDAQLVRDPERIFRLYLFIVRIGAIVGGIPLLLLAAPVYALALRKANESWPLAIGCGLIPGLYILLGVAAVPCRYSFRDVFNLSMAGFVSTVGVASMCAIHALHLRTERRKHGL